MPQFIKILCNWVSFWVAFLLGGIAVQYEVASWNWFIVVGVAMFFSGLLEAIGESTVKAFGE